MLGKLSVRQEENTAFCAFHCTKLEDFSLPTCKLKLIGIAVVKQILALLDLNAEH